LSSERTGSSKIFRFLGFPNSSFLFRPTPEKSRRTTPEPVSAFFDANMPTAHELGHILPSAVVRRFGTAFNLVLSNIVIIGPACYITIMFAMTTF